MSLEYMLAISFVINLLIIKTAEAFLKEKGRLFFLSAFMGACFAILSPHFYLNKIGNILFNLGANIWYVCISFRFKTFKKFSQIYALQLISTLLYGGVCYIVSNFLPIKTYWGLLAILICLYFIIKLLFRKIKRKEEVEKFCYDIEIENDGKVTTWKAFLDSGNLLYDPITQKPVCLVNFKAFTKIFDDVSIADIVTRSAKIKKIKFAHYIAFNTLNNSDKILVFQVDKLKINTKEIEKATLGLVLKNFNQAFGSDVILHNNFAFGG